MKHCLPTLYKYVASLSAEPLGCSASGRFARFVVECPTCCCVCRNFDRSLLPDNSSLLNPSVAIVCFSFYLFIFFFKKKKRITTADNSSLLLSLVVDYSPPPAQSSAAPTSLFPPRSLAFSPFFLFLLFSLRIPRSRLIPCRLSVFICSGELFQGQQ